MFASLATEEEIEVYSGSMSHVFAVALHRRAGFRLIAVIDAARVFWEADSDPTDFLPNVKHILCWDERRGFWDVSGKMTYDEVMERWEESAECCEIDLTVADEDELRMYVGCWAVEGGPMVDRQLAEYSEDDIAAAATVVERALSTLPNFPYDEQAAAAELLRPMVRLDWN